LTELPGATVDVRRPLAGARVCAFTIISNPRPVNLAGEVLYRNILGRVRGDCPTRASGEVRLTYGSCSIADIDALELNSGIIGGEDDSLDCVCDSNVLNGEGGVLDFGPERVMVATEAPLERSTIPEPGGEKEVGVMVDQPEVASDIRRASAVGE